MASPGYAEFAAAVRQREATVDYAKAIQAAYDGFAQGDPGAVVWAV
jgi:hypothetical protein